MRLIIFAALPATNSNLLQAATLTSCSSNRYFNFILELLDRNNTLEDVRCRFIKCGLLSRFNIHHTRLLPAPADSRLEFRKSAPFEQRYALNMKGDSFFFFFQTARIRFTRLARRDTFNITGTVRLSGTYLSPGQSYTGRPSPFQRRTRLRHLTHPSVKRICRRVIVLVVYDLSFKLRISYA
jgi:hypothetical protein